MLKDAEHLYGELLKSFRETITGLGKSISVMTFMISVLLGLYEVSETMSAAALRLRES